MRKVSADKIFEITPEGAGHDPLVIMPKDHYESMVATMEELKDRRAMSALHESGRNIALGEIYSHEEAFEDRED